MPVSALQKVKRVFVKVLLSTAVAYQPRQEGPTCGRPVCQEVPRELSSCFGSKRCCSWELVGGPSVLSEPLFAGVLAEVVCTQTLSELLLRKKHMRKHVTCL